MYLFTKPVDKHEDKEPHARLTIVSRRSSSSRSRSSPARARRTPRTVVAYSTPKPVMAKIIPALQQTPAGKGVSFTPVLRRLDDQAKAVAAGLPADVVFLSTGDDVNLARRRRGSSTRTGTSSPTTGIAADTVVVFAVRNGNPKHIKGWDDLIKPGVAGRDAEPVQLGLGEVEHPRRLRRAAPPRQDRRAGDRRTSRSSSSTSSRRTRSGRTRRTRSSSGKGDVLLTYESEAINARLGGQGHPVRDPAPDDADRAPDRGAEERARTRTLANKFIRFTEGDARAGAVRRRTAAARSTRRSRRSTRRSSRRGPGIFTIDDKIDRRLARGRQEVVRPEQRASWRRSSSSVGGPTAG